MNKFKVFQNNINLQKTQSIVKFRNMRSFNNFLMIIKLTYKKKNMLINILQNKKELKIF